MIPETLRNKDSRRVKARLAVRERKRLVSLALMSLVFNLIIKRFVKRRNMSVEITMVPNLITAVVCVTVLSYVVSCIYALPHLLQSL